MAGDGRRTLAGGVGAVAVAVAERRARFARLEAGQYRRGAVPAAGLAAKQRLDNALPTHYTVPTGSRLPIRYEAGKPPALAVRLQEVFGEQRSPMLAEGRIPVVLELLTGAPAVANHRRSGGLLARRLSRGAKEMKGRYPKHVWPDDPATAVPTRRTKKYQ